MPNFAAPHVTVFPRSRKSFGGGYPPSRRCVYQTTGRGGHRKSVQMQQIGVIPKTARESQLAWLQEHFPGQLISLKGCAPHSPGSSPLYISSGAVR